MTRMTPRLPHPAQLGHDATGCLELVEADDEDLDRTGHVLVCHCRTPLGCGSDYAAE